MNHLVKILRHDDGEPVDNPPWCLIFEQTGGDATFCTGVFFGAGESAAEYETKEVERGGITCRDCLKKIKKIKAIKL